jgi:hypothetical protein
MAAGTVGELRRVVQTRSGARVAGSLSEGQVENWDDLDLLRDYRPRRER